MATTSTKPDLDVTTPFAGIGAPPWPRGRSASTVSDHSAQDPSKPSQHDALQALLAFSALHEQLRRRKALAARNSGFDAGAPVAPVTEFEQDEQFVLDEVLQLVAERAVAITGADGLAIALAENNEIVLRAAAGTVRPDVGARIERDSAFSGACFRTAQIIRCDDTETDDRVNLYACRQLGARSMVAVPLCGRRRVIGLLEAFSSEPFGFNDSDVGSLELLAELVLAALKPEDEDRFAESAELAEAKLATATTTAPLPAIAEASPVKEVASAKPAAQIEDKARAAAAHSGAVVEPVTAPVAAPQFRAEPNSVAKEVFISETVEPEPLAGHHPGIVLVLVLIMFAAVLAGGLWWKLKNDQLGDMVVRPEPKITRPGAVAKQMVAPSSSTPSTTLDEQSNSAVTATAADQDSGSAVPQEAAKLPRITGIRHWSSADSSTVVLDLEDQVQYEAHRLSGPDRIYFDLHDTTLSPGFEGKTIEVGDSLLAKVRVAQPSSGLTRVVLETRGNSNYSVSLEPNPYRLVVQVRKLGANTKQVSLFPEAPEAEKLAIVVPPPTKEDLQLRARVPKMRIVVDAGHGGWDLGTVGRRGLLEKDLVLEIAQRLGKLLESRLGAEVILTRNDDNYIPLDERAGKANQAQADLFISVHANYSDLPSARGVETYYTNFFSAPDSKNNETRDIGNGSTNGLTANLSSVELHARVEQSRRLAASVQRSLYGTLSVQNPGLRDRGVKAASFVVLTETAMPGILAEVSFVSSPTDEQRLRSDGYREQIAEALYKGIARYAANSRSVKVASAAK